MHQPTDRRATLLRTLGIRAPIVQAPMAGVSTPALAAAVSNAGGLGSLGVGATDSDGARKMIRDTRALTGRPFNINVFCHRPAQADAAVERAWLDWLAPAFRAYGATPPASLSEIYTSFVADHAMQAMLVEEKPAVVSFHFGLPSADVIAALKRAGITLFATATNLDEARQVAAAGIDAIVAQGIEAGGHRGVFDSTAHDDRLGTFALTRLIVRECALPVIAAGGIMDGAGIAAALALGAQAAQLGTAFLTCAESAIAADWKARLLASADTSTQVTRAITGRHARGLRNTLMARLGEHVADAAPYPVQNALTQPLRQAAARANDGDYLSLWAGQGAPLARRRGDTLTTSQLVAALDAEWRASAA